jgi:DNA topoisomerase-2
MNLYTDKYLIKTYTTAEEILEEFYSWRLGFYTKRKKLLLNKYTDEIKFINHQIKFIELVIKNKGNIFNMETEQINKYLKSQNIDTVDNSYDYLIDMTFKQLTKANLDKLYEKVSELKLLYKNTNNKTDKEMWLSDLIELNNILQ